MACASGPSPAATPSGTPASPDDHEVELRPPAVGPGVDDVPGGPVRLVNLFLPRTVRRPERLRLLSRAGAVSYRCPLWSRGIPRQTPRPLGDGSAVAALRAGQARPRMHMPFSS